MDATLLTSDAFWQDPQPVSFETSGSTGLPKQVVISKEALLISAKAVNQHLGVTRDSIWGLALPLNHVGGFGVAARAYQAGCLLKQFPHRWNAEQFTLWAAHERITQTSLVPTQVHDLVEKNQRAPNTLQAVVVGGGQLETALGQAARGLGWPVLASYGMTEASSQIATQSLNQLDLPYQPFPLPILPIWQCEISPAGTLCIQGPALFSGYRVDGIFTPRITSWHETSDCVKLESNMIYPLGRADRLVKILGELVNPEAIEKQIVLISNGELTLENFIILTVPHERRGQLLVPVMEAPCDSAAIESLLASYSQTAPGHAQLTAPHFIESFPRSELGKIRRNDVAKGLEIQPSFPAR
jgi:o-succinylbenzoate---CoA ligase